MTEVKAGAVHAVSSRRIATLLATLLATSAISFAFVCAPAAAQTFSGETATLDPATYVPGTDIVVQTPSPGSATLNIPTSGSGSLSLGNLVVGRDAGASGIMVFGNLSGSAGPTTTSNGRFDLGLNGFGFGVLAGASRVAFGNLSLGGGPAGNGYLAVYDAGTILTISNVVEIGAQASGAVNVEYGATLTANGDVWIGRVGNASGQLTVTRGGIFNHAGNGEFDVGGRVDATTSGTLSIGGGGGGTLSTNRLTVGLAGTGVVTVGEGGLLAANVLDNGVVQIGQDGQGSAAVTVQAGGVLRSGSARQGAVNLFGTLNIGNADGAPSAAGVVQAGTVAMGGAAVLQFRHNSTAAGADAYTFTPGVTGGGSGTGLIRVVAGTTLFSGSSAGFGGRTAIDGGNLILTNALGGAVQVGAAGTLTLRDGSSTGAIANAGTVAIDNVNALTVTAVLSGAGGLTKAGAGTTRLTGDLSAFTGTTGVTGGNLILANTLGGSVTVGRGGTFTLADGASVSSVANAGTVSIENANALAVTTALSGTGGLTKAGAGTAMLSGANTMTGAVTVNAGTLAGTAASLGAGTSYVVNGGGTLAVTDTLALGANGATTATVSGAGATLAATGLDVGDAAGTTGALVVRNGGTVVADTVRIGGDGTGTVTVDGAGSVLRQTADTLYIGAGVAAAGDATLTLSNGGALRVQPGVSGVGLVYVGVPADPATYAGDAKLVFGSLSSPATTAAGNMTPGDYVILDTRGSLIFSHSGTSADNYTFGAVVAGGYGNGVIRSQAGTTRLTGSLSGFTGATEVTGGNLILANALGGAVTVGSGGTFTLADGASVSSVANAGTVGIENANALAVTTALSGTGGLTKAGAGTATLSGANTMTGAVTVNAGTLTGTAASLGAGTSYVVNGGGTLAVTDTLALGANGATTATVSGAGATLAATGLDVGDAAGTTGTLVVRNGGTVSVGSGSGVLSVGGAGTGRLLLGSVTPDSTTTAGTVAAAAIELGSGGTLAFSHGQDAGGYDFATTVVGNGVIQSLAGRTALSGDLSGFTGGTTVTGGNLVLRTALAGPVTIAANGTFTLTDSGSYTGTLTNSGTLAIDTAGAKSVVANYTGSGRFQKDGTGTVTLSGTNALTGGVVVRAGVLKATAAALGTGALVVNANAALDYSDSGNSTLANALSGAGRLVKTGSGVLTYTGDGSGFTGQTEISAGGLTLTGALGGSATIGAAGTFTLTDTATFGGAITNSGILAFDFSRDKTVSATFAGTGALVKDGGGRLTLTGANALSGGLVVRRGTVASGVASLGTGRLLVDANGVLENVDTAAATFANTLTGTGTFAKSGAGTLAYTGDGSGFAGSTLVSAGNYRLAGALGGTVTIRSGAIFTLTDAAAFSGAISNSGLLAFDTAGSKTVNATYAGTGGLQKDGAGTLTLTGNNALTGGVVVNAGTLTGTAAAIGTGASYKVAGGTLAVTGAFDIGASAASVATVDGVASLLSADSIALGRTSGGNGTLIVANGGTVRAGAGGNGVLDVAPGGTGTVVLGSIVSPSTTAAGTIAASSVRLGAQGSLVFSHDQAASNPYVFGNAVTGTGAIRSVAGYTTLTGNLSGFTGQTTVTGGTLVLATSLAAPVTVGSGGVFTISDAGSYTGALDNSGVLAFNTATARSINASFSGSGSLRMDGTGTITLTGANTSTGGVIVNSGTVAGTVASLGAGPYQITGGTLALATATDANLAAVITGAGVFAKSGAGTLTYAGNGAAFAGTTRVDAGGLVLGSVLGGAATIATGATLTLADAGGIGGTIANAGTLAVSGSASRTVGNVVSGAGAVVMNGSGNVTFTAANSFAGGLTVNSGTVTGSRASLGTGGYRIAGGTLAYVAVADETLSVPLSGAGSFSKSGAGIVAIDRDNTAFSGSFAVTGGGLRLNGTLGGAVVAGSGTVLSGNGKMASLNVQAGGIVAPGNSIGTLNVTGSGTFASGSIYQVEIDAAGASDRLVVGGTATLNGATVSVLKLSPAFRGGTRYTILTAAGGVSGTFASEVQQAAPFLKLSLAYDSSNAYLDIARNFDIQSVALTANQRAIGNATVALGQGNAVYEALLVSEDAGSARTALNALSGEIHASARTVAIDNSRLVRDAVRARLDTASGSGAWTQGFYNWGSSKAYDGSAPVSRDTAGFIIGVDKAFGDDETWRVGVAGGYTDTTVNAPGVLSGGHVKIVHGSAYAGGSFGPARVKVGIGYGATRNDLRRTVRIGTFSDDSSARYDGILLHGFGEVGAPVDLSGGTVEPFANVAYVHSATDAFAERGGAASLRGKAPGAGLTLSTLGVRATTSAAGPFSVHAGAGWQHGYGDINAATRIGYGSTAGSPSFAITGAAVSRDAGVVTIEGRAQLSPALTIAASYNGSIGTQGYDNAARATLNFSF